MKMEQGSYSATTREEKEKCWGEEREHDIKSGDTIMNIFGERANPLVLRRMKESGWA